MEFFCSLVLIVCTFRHTISYQCCSKGIQLWNPPPVMGCGDEEDFCLHCFMCPCAVLKRPDFLGGSSDAHIRIRQHRFRLYRGFWKMLKDLCLWTDNHYLECKRRVTQEHDQREIIPSCVVDVGVLIIVLVHTVQLLRLLLLLQYDRKWDDATQIHLGYLIQTTSLPGQPPELILVTV